MHLHVFTIAALVTLYFIVSVKYVTCTYHGNNNKLFIHATKKPNHNPNLTLLLTKITQ